MNQVAPLTLALALCLASMSGHADSFDQASEVTLQKSKETKSGVSFHVDGQIIGAYVLELHAEYIVAANREHGRIVIRRSSIDAIAAP
ncbi:MAG: hypothetical protein IPK97_17435 [Ahniella sp.]|nr:hypothetical protein [Ahniella sp.]